MSKRYRRHEKTLHDSHADCDDAHKEGLEELSFAAFKVALMEGGCEPCLHCFRDEPIDQLQEGEDEPG